MNADDPLGKIEALKIVRSGFTVEREGHPQLMGVRLHLFCNAQFVRHDFRYKSPLSLGRERARPLSHSERIQRLAHPVADTMVMMAPVTYLVGMGLRNLRHQAGKRHHRN